MVSSPTRDGDRSGNCPAGLLIHQTITNPNYPDFYLQSHAGLLGSESTAMPAVLLIDADRTAATASRPAHYVVLENETSLSPLKYVCAVFVYNRLSR